MSEEAATVAQIDLGLVDDCIERFFTVSSARARRFGRPSEELWRVLRKASMGGKRFRPRMVLTAYGFLGGTDHHAAANVAAAYELLHTALVVHDDVIDRDWSRRGEPNVAGSFRDTGTTGGLALPTAEHRGVSAAVIAGDLALVAAARFIEASGVTGERRSRLLEILDDAVFASAAGEMTDVDLAHGVMPSVDEVLAMERAKTSVYSFEAPLQSGAVLAGAPEFVVEALGAFGREIGIAYQIVDDLLGVYGDEAATGKSVLGDLREGKRTMLVAYAATTDCWDDIAPYLGDPDLTEERAAELRATLETCGARSAAESRIAEHAALARAELAALPYDLADRLEGLVTELLERVR
ncbi:polyprenyl synthetase family protein [Curtobacterium sp. Csp1]|uniref:Polyprenyl synthetase family protein n=1 Tax=Curtobacterium citreum TaxID=2036 RepID=A0ABT2HIL3_9MICO|nr:MULTISPECIES: polyprenyl synthetase family protein [Curtobacterium]MCS6523116.1 polyprenyl synthetase family protein [Curtobacterium citreum]QKS12542.1 polyprenyl synthetase family protein [Curtobacterium sp. csp3]QKS20147.1 polyprenyl synthetase family protein [Curtobacterium sp. Csp1]QKS21869.1 polyprenyl synthetase family protein [Curtobacterium sp. Csp1]TQJ26788.1 geranylgeranyl diphosphate synthase type II [Curtobacterium citreum]